MDKRDKILEASDIPAPELVESPVVTLDTIVPEPEIRNALDSPESGMFDAIIIGGGPAGMTAGIYLSRKRIKTLLISPDLGGQVLWNSDIENYPGYRVISGWDLAASFQRQLEMQNIFLRLNDNAVRLDLSRDGGSITTERGNRYEYRSLVVASGKRSRLLGVPGEEEYRGRGVTYCATCDAPLYRGETVAVIGGGNSALSAANDLLALGCMVYLINILPGIQADAVLVERAVATRRLTVYTNHMIDEITGIRNVTGVRFHNRETGETRTEKVTGVFIEIGLVPNSRFTQGILAQNSEGEIIVNCRCETNIPGIFAAGDVTSIPEKQIVIAAGEGAKAALGVNDYLMRRKKS